MDEQGIDIPAHAARTANSLHRTYPVVPRDDIYQEIMIWVLKHPAKVEEYQDGSGVGKGKLLKSMFHAGLKFAQAEKSMILGYKPEDNYYYELGLIRDVLALLWDEEAWTNPPQPVEQAKVKHRSVSEGGNYVATLADVSRVVALLPEEDQQLLKDHYHAGITSAEIASRLGTTAGAVDGRMARLTRKLQKLLGGPRPDITD